MKHILCDIIPSSLSFNNQVSVFFTPEKHIIDWKMSDHFMSWELPGQRLNHQAQSHRHDFHQQTWILGNSKKYFYSGEL